MVKISTSSLNFYYLTSLFFYSDELKISTSVVNLTMERSNFKNYEFTLAHIQSVKLTMSCVAILGSVSPF